MNKNNSEISQTDNTTIPSKEYEQEIKQGFFSKLFSSFGKKALPSGKDEKLHVTNTSITSMMRFGSFRAKLLNIFDAVQKLFIMNKEALPKNSLPPEVVEENYVKESTDISKGISEKEIIVPRPKVVIMAQSEPIETLLKAEQIDTSSLDILNKDDDKTNDQEQKLTIEEIDTTSLTKSQTLSDKKTNETKSKDDERE